MITKSKENVFNFPVPFPHDLFGHIPVTNDEVVLWVESVSVFDRHSPRFAWYVKNYAVVEKIQMRKKEYITLDQYFIQEAANDSRY